jgi:AcrR family transcriptional regulator
VYAVHNTIAERFTNVYATRIRKRPVDDGLGSAIGSPTMTNRRPLRSRHRATYRHGDLRRALLDAGIALARHGGPDAVVLREATRRAGVVPNAAYRHFKSRDELLQAVRDSALAALAVTMEDELAAVRRDENAADYARAGLRAIGTAYLRFAQAEPGLFRTAFASRGPAPGEVERETAGTSGLGPFELLGAALDRLVGAGVLPSERRPAAEYLAWSAVHGLSMLVLDGPLRRMTDAERESVAGRLLTMVEKGI